MRLTRSTLAPTLLVVGLGLALTGCTENGADADPGATGGGALTVTSTDDECTVSATTVPSGVVTFSVTNKGSQVTEFYLLGQDKLRIVGEVENIGPALSRDLTVTAVPGTYYTQCKPGMAGDGIVAEFTVTDSGADALDSGDDAALIAQATNSYHEFVEQQAGELVEQTQDFVTAYLAGQDDAARALYPVARTHWERIEPVAESFGDLDPLIDAREADLEPGQEWTGWHVLEKDLWPPATGYTALTPAQRTDLANRLLADTTTLAERAEDLTFTVDQIANGAKELLDEVATGKVTGEEEIWSHTDLWDFQANLDGARTAWEGLRPVLQTKDAALDTELAERFDALQALLDTHRSGDGFVAYTALTPDQVKTLADAVNALSEPLSKLTAAVLA